jgi:lipopolysaccharide/colanic/teichoic acid biosynthesis glycosyltransferase
MKRLFDLIVSFTGLLAISPVFITAMFLIWLQDRHSPFYVAKRVGKNGLPFNMIKLRSMIVEADKTGVDSTAADDKRITAIGHFIRRYKLDEFSQLINVFLGQMSLVGPRPNVDRDVALYTDEERRLLTVRPGVTDLSSIVFSDEGDILEGSADPDLQYNRIIRPWKSRLGLLYIDHMSLLLDIKIIYLTVIAIISKSRALGKVVEILSLWVVDEKLVEVCRREGDLPAYPPPGAASIVGPR